MALATALPETQTERGYLLAIREAGRRDDVTWRIFADWLLANGGTEAEELTQAMRNEGYGERNVNVEAWGGFRIERRRAHKPEYADGGQCSAAVYRGENWKPVWTYRFRDAAERENYVACWKLTELEKADNRKERADAKKTARENFVNPAKVGDVYYTSWGYEQTNVDWFQVVKVTAKGVQLRPIRGSITETSYQSGTTLPIPAKITWICGKPVVSESDFTGPARTVLFQIYRDGGHYLPAEHGSYYPHDGSAKGWSSYH